VVRQPIRPLTSPPYLEPPTAQSSVGPAPVPASRLGQVAALIVNYNAADHLEACLASVRANGVNDIVIIDNGSVDDSRQRARAAGARWVPMGANVGYGRAVNRGAATPEAQAASYLLVCNPDTELTEGVVPTLVDSLAAQPDLGLVGPRLSNPDGSLYPSARTFPSLVDAVGHGLLGMVAPRNRFTRRYRMLDWDHRGSERVDWVSGACFLARRAAWDAVGGFDPMYFMYMEDVDLCWRLGRSGWGVGYQPGAVVMHVQGVSTNHHPYRMLAAHHLSMWKFANRTTVGADRAVLPLVAAGLVARLAAATARHGFGDATGRAANPLARRTQKPA
jgi:N-acetylglucosaminyl-diphospho-decaprenol L-rhamnosyltransferase